MYAIINNKKYEINTDISWGAYKGLQLAQETQDPYLVEQALKEILVPCPKEKELDNFSMSDIQRVFTMYANEEQEKEREIKKKLSQS